MAKPSPFEAALQQRLPFLQKHEEMLRGRTPVYCTDVTRLGAEITTPPSLQHVGEQIVEVVKGDWTTVQGLRGPIVSYLTELAEFWEVVFRRHRDASAVFAAAPRRPYCLVLRSFTSVTHPIEVWGARAVAYVNEPALDANVAAMLVQQASWLNPVHCMHTDDMQLLVRVRHAMPAFRVGTTEWQEILDDAIASSGAIILYLDGESPGVAFEIERIRANGLESRTLVVHHEKTVPTFVGSGSYAGIMPIRHFLRPGGKHGPGTLSERAERILRDLMSTATTRVAPSRRLITLPCEIVDQGGAAAASIADPRLSYFVTASNGPAFVSYVQNFPNAMLHWNAISQDMRLRGIQPSLADFNALYVELRMAFLSAACLGFTSSMAGAIGLLCKVASMAKQDRAQNRERVRLYMQILDIAKRFDALTVEHVWSEKIEAFRESILDDPFM